MAKLAIFFRIRNSKLGIFMFVINVLQKAEMVECNKRSAINPNGISNAQHGQHQQIMLGKSDSVAADIVCHIALRMTVDHYSL